jgi:hypothetical protein
MVELAALFGLGAFHGINPGMGWLFAVALGMQEQRASGVWRALLPLVIGHALAVAAVLGIAVAAGVVLPRGAVQAIVGVLLISLGVRRLVRRRHVAFGGMKVGYVGLTAWSLLMATAHGAGLMVLPIVLGAAADVQAQAPPAHHAAHGMDPAAAAQVFAALGATAVHTLGYLTVTAFVAWIVYARLGVGLLRRAWINLDVIWAAALVVTGLAALMV